MPSPARVIRDIFVDRSYGLARGRWDDPSFYAPAAVVLLLLSVLAGVALRLTGWVGGAYSWFNFFSVFTSTRDDSWFVMGLAYDRVTGQSPGSLHDLFFIDRVKFQYPASSLLLYSVLDFVGIAPTPQALNVSVWFSILATPFVIYRLCIAFMDKNHDALNFTPADKHLIAAAFAVATLFFYPIMISWRLGQIQAILNLAFALACLYWVTDRKVAAGALIGASCLVKPQFSLFLIWALLRRERDFAVGQALVLGSGSLLSLILYGWSNNIYYLEVLQYISRRGEIFWDNSTINGLANGFFHPDETLIFKYNEFAPYNLATYAITTLTSILIIAMSLFAHRSSRASGSILDFMTAGLSFTLASPIAWGHHYAVVFPMLVVAFLAIARHAKGLRRRNLFIGWAVCLLLFSNYWNITQPLADTPAAFLQYWRLYAAFGLLWILYRLQSEISGLSSDLGSEKASRAPQEKNP